MSARVSSPIAFGEHETVDWHPPPNAHGSEQSECESLELWSPAGIPGMSGIDLSPTAMCVAPFCSTEHANPLPINDVASRAN